jgi:transposase
MLQETQDGDGLAVDRIAALDIGKAEVACCVRVPSPSGKGGRAQEVDTYSTMTRSLQALADRLRALRVTRVVMEATSDYWKPVFYLLEAAGFEVWLVNAKDVKHLPGRPKTDTIDAVWLCKVAERGMLRPSFVPPEPIRLLRDLTRYRIDLVGERGREKNRVEKLLEDAQIKLSVVASDIFGVSGRDMMAALIAGERDPAVLSQLARSRMRAKIGALEEAFVGRFNDHHAFLLAKMLARVDALDTDIAAVEARIEDLLDPFADARERLDTIPGIGRIAAATIIAEIGVDMTRFPTAAHLASWAKFAPIVSESAGKQKGKNATGKGNRYLARTLGEAVVAASRTDTFLGERYRRLARRRGKKKAIVAVGRSILIIIWHLLADPSAEYIDLGPTHYDTAKRTQRAIRNHIRGLQALGYSVTLNPAA